MNIGDETNAAYLVGYTKHERLAQQGRLYGKFTVAQALFARFFKFF